MFDVFGVYLINFRKNFGGELNGQHYGIVLSSVSKKDGTVLIAPITSKKRGVKYRGGFTINCCKYQTNPSQKTAFVKVRKIREVDKNRILSKKMYELDKIDILKLNESIKKVFRCFDK